MKAVIERHYPKSDTECEGEYWKVNVFIDDVLAKVYGDYYHDKGLCKAKAFIEGIVFVTKHKVPVEYTNIADLEDYGDV